jgi:hypothetical protein
MPGVLRWLIAIFGIRARVSSPRSSKSHPANNDTRQGGTVEGHAPPMRETWQCSQDIVGSLRFCATMQPSVPLRVLSRHGELHGDIRKPPPAIARSPHEGCWTPMLKGQKSITGTMSSSVGYIPTNGGEFLVFLIAIREIVESPTTIEERVRVLSAELARPNWNKFIHKLELVEGDLVGLFFPCAIGTIPGLSSSIADALVAIGLDTASKIAAATDAELMAVKGVGPAKLKAIRGWQCEIEDRDAVRLDRVTR